MPTLVRFAPLSRRDRVNALRAAAALRTLDPADARLQDLRMPSGALRAVSDGTSWTGAVRSGTGRFFAATVPLARSDRSVPAAMVLATPDVVLADFGRVADRWDNTQTVLRAEFGA